MTNSEHDHLARVVIDHIQESIGSSSSAPDAYQFTSQLCTDPPRILEERSRPTRIWRRSPGSKDFDCLDAPDHITFQVGAVSFDQLGNCVGVAQDSKRLLQRLEIVRTDENRRRCPVAGNHDTLMMALNSLDKLRETVSNGPKRFTHGHNCATPEPNRDEHRFGSITLNLRSGRISSAFASRITRIVECERTMS